MYAITHELDSWLLNNPLHEQPLIADLPATGNRQCAIGLRGILITEELARRPIKTSKESRRLEVLKTLGKNITSPPEKLLAILVQHALELCDAESAGLSLLHEDDHRQFFHWDELTGLLKNCIGQTTPRTFSPCGVTLDRRSPQLFSYPARYFEYFKTSEYPIVEGLVIPIVVNGDGLGTIWIVSHHESLMFNSQDVATMMSLAGLCEVALSCTIGKCRISKQRHAS